MIIQYAVMRKQIKIGKAFSNSIKYFIASIVMFVFCYSLRRMGNIWYVTILQILIGMGIYIVILWILKDEMLRKTFSILKKGKKNE